MSSAELQALADLDDRELVEQTRRGELVAFDLLVERYRDKALRLVRSTLGARSDDEDIVQDVFIKVFNSLDRFRGDSTFSTWLYTITINRCRDEIRKGKLRRFFSFDDWFSGDGQSRLTTENGEQLEVEERRMAVREAMNRLEPQTKMLLHLREIEELSYRELAEIFKVEIGTIKSRLARGREKLRQELVPLLTDGAEATG